MSVTSFFPDTTLCNTWRRICQADVFLLSLLSFLSTCCYNSAFQPACISSLPVVNQNYC